MNFPDPTTLGGRLWRGALAAPAGLFRAAAALRSAAYRRGYLETVRPPAPVVCVGNLTVGGSGKTPVTAWLAARAGAAGRRVAILTRGHGRASREVVLVANRGGEDLPGVDAMGDEPRLLARRLPGVPLAVGADRALAALRAWEAFAPDLFIMDDGRQHHRLHRDADLVCIDARRAHDVWVRRLPAPLLPAGPWREAPRGSWRADVLLVTRAERLSAEERSDLAAALRAIFTGPVGYARYRLSLTSEDGAPVEARGARLLALSGLADPVSFESGLARSGADVAGERFGDHHVFTAEERERALERARRESRRLVVTEKDAQRLPADFPAAVARLELDWEDTSWTTVVDSVIASKPSAS